MRLQGREGLDPGSVDLKHKSERAWRSDCSTCEREIRDSGRRAEGRRNNIPIHGLAERDTQLRDAFKFGVPARGAGSKGGTLYVVRTIFFRVSLKTRLRLNCTRPGLQFLKLIPAAHVHRSPLHVPCLAMLRCVTVPLRRRSGPSDVRPESKHDPDMGTANASHRCTSRRSRGSVRGRGTACTADVTRGRPTRGVVSVGDTSIPLPVAVHAPASVDDGCVSTSLSLRALTAGAPRMCRLVVPRWLLAAERA